MFLKWNQKYVMIAYHWTGWVRQSPSWLAGGCRCRSWLAPPGCPRRCPRPGPACRRRRGWGGGRAGSSPRTRPPARRRPGAGSCGASSHAQHFILPLQLRIAIFMFHDIIQSSLSYLQRCSLKSGVAVVIMWHVSLLVSNCLLCSHLIGQWV